MKYTTLVNKQNKFKESFLNKINLVKTTDVDNKEVFLEEETYKAYIELKEYLKDKNIDIGITSAYRTIDYQKSLYDKFPEENNQEYVDNYVALPGYSEHHTALAIDIGININGEYIDDITDKTNDIYEEIHKHLYKFGFILRYPKNKENITGYQHEPWHIRYVGKLPARIMYQEDLTLEEYLNNYSCVLYINKPKDCTSFDVVNIISKLFGIKRVGHTGTLDPMATGVLIVTVGKATKIVELLTAKDKEYIAGVELGIKTDTYDNTGKVLEKKEVPNNLSIEETLNSFKKTYLQEVPIYSAVKVDGKKLYDYARNNKEVTLPKKEVTIKEIELLEKNNNTFTIKTLVTKGCYIRSLINDIGNELNTGAIMTSLIRTKQGNISIEETNTLEEIKNNKYKLHTIEEVLDYPTIEVDNELEFKIKNGVVLDNNWNIKDKVLFKNNNKLLGIYEVYNNKLKVWKNFT